MCKNVAYTLTHTTTDTQRQKMHYILDCWTCLYKRKAKLTYFFLAVSKKHFSYCIDRREKLCLVVVVSLRLIALTQVCVSDWLKEKKELTCGCRVETPCDLMQNTKHLLKWAWYRLIWSHIGNIFLLF